MSLIRSNKEKRSREGSPIDYLKNQVRGGSSDVLQEAGITVMPNVKEITVMSFRMQNNSDAQ